MKYTSSKCAKFISVKIKIPAPALFEKLQYSKQKLISTVPAPIKDALE